jgi:uncharacterized protein YndB with AHSA1/START domain
VLEAFTDPAVLARWWGGELTTTLTPGGPYTVRFRHLDRAMTGQVVSYEPGGRLEFTWAWDHEPATVRRTMLVTAARQTGFDGTVLTVVHGPHGNGAAEDTARTEHREGWEFFLPRLGELLASSASG